MSDAGPRRDLDAVEETPVWLEVNGKPAVTWMCTPAQLEELCVGWLHGEGYIQTLADLRGLKPCAGDLGFRAEVADEAVARIAADERRKVLASGCGAVSVALADPESLPQRPPRGAPPQVERMRALFKEMFHRGERYAETGGVHAAALTDGETILEHAEDIGRHNAVDKVIGGALLHGRAPDGLGLLVTGRVSGELAFKAARAGIAFVATPSVPSTLATVIARRAGVVLVGRAVSAKPQVHQST